MFKKSISVLLAVLMICAVIPLSAIGASAASDTQAELTESLGTNDEPLELEIGTEFQDAFRTPSQKKTAPLRSALFQKRQAAMFFMLMQTHTAILSCLTRTKCFPRECTATQMIFR